MTGKTVSPRLLSALEAAHLFQYANLADMYTAIELAGAYSTLKGAGRDPRWDAKAMLWFIYDAGRVQGIREERAKRKAK